MFKNIKNINFLIRGSLAVLVALLTLFTSGVASTGYSGRVASAAEPISNGIVISIDPGHQQHANNLLEPDGPNSNLLKPKVSAGATGTATGKPEYVLNLEVSFILRDHLRSMGYTVVMTRESHDVNISNKERAAIANEAKADLFIRIHADGTDDSHVHGISVLYPSQRNPYTKQIYEASRKAAENIMDGLISHTKAASRGTVARDDLSGFNWSKVPTVLVEMGFLSNPTEDKQMSVRIYQSKLADGMIEGIETYFRDHPVSRQANVPTKHTNVPHKAKVFKNSGTSWFHILIRKF